MLDLLHAVYRPPNSPLPISLNMGFRADLAWWQMFLEQWNGVSFLLPPAHLPKMEVTSDASGSWGCGAWHAHSWFQVKWDHMSESLSIAERELIPVILACAAWGRSWHGHQVVCHCDNQVVVASLHSRTSRHKGIMHLIRCLVFIEATLGFYVCSSYIDTKTNHLADEDNLCSFLSKVTTADHWCQPLCCSSYWTHTRTGHVRAGSLGSARFSGRSSPSMQSTYKAALKHTLPDSIPIPCDSAIPVTSQLT